MKLLKELLTMFFLICTFTGAVGCSFYNFPEEMSDEPELTEYYNSDVGDILAKQTGDGKFTLNYTSSDTMNPLLCSQSINMPVTGLIFEGLFCVDNSFNFYPVLCKRWNSTDGITFSFELESGIRFHDGSELTINDVIYSLDKARESELYSGRLRTVQTVYEEDGKLLITIDRPNMRFPALLDFPIMKYATGDRAVPVGTGPYVFFKAEDSDYLEAFGDYRDRSLLPIDRFYLKEFPAEELISAFESSELDMVITNKSEMGYVEFSEDYEKRYIDTTELHFIGFNHYSDFCASATRRLIISSIIDRQYLVSEIMQDSESAVLPVSPASKYYLQDVADSALIDKGSIEDYMISAFVEDYNQDGILEYIKGNDIKKFTLDFIVNRENVKKVTAAQHIADWLSEYGFDVRLRKLDWAEFEYALSHGIYDMYYGEVKLTSDFDLTELLSTKGSINFGVYDVQLDYLINRLNGTKSWEGAARELYSYIADNAHLAPLLFEKRLVFTHRGVVSNMSPTQHNIFNNITQWELADTALRT